MNEFDIEREISADEDVRERSEDIEIDGESFHIEEFEPTAEEYRELVEGLYKSFYDEDIKSAAARAIEASRTEMLSELEAKMQEREQSIREEMKREILQKISKRRLRPDENGIMAQRSSPKRDVSKMTREERAAAAKKAASGFIINLK